MVEIRFTFALDVFKCRNRILQISNDLPADLTSHDASHNHEAGGRQPGGNEEESKQEFGAKSHKSALNSEAIADAVHRKKVDGTCRFPLQLLAKLQDVVVHRARAGVVLISPDLVQQLIA